MNKGKSLTIEILNAHAATSTPNRSLKTLSYFSSVIDCYVQGCVEVCFKCRYMSVIVNELHAHKTTLM